MTAPAPESQQQEPKSNDKELNFRALEAKMQQERNARLEAERRAQDAERRMQENEAKMPLHSDDDNDTSDDTLVDHKRLAKTLSSFERSMDKKIEQKAEEKARMMLEKERREMWMRNNNDFYDVMQHADKLYEKDRELAETILEMPESFERQKLVYKNIKALGLHKPTPAPAPVQEKVDANRRSPFYQPSGIGAAPYQGGGDFSPQGQKAAHAKMQELKSRLRL